MLHFYELAKESLSNRNIILRSDKLPGIIEENRKEKKELYHSIWLYDESVQLHMFNYKTIRSFKGKRKLPIIIFDIDKKQDTDDFVLQRAREFIKVLQEDWGVNEEELAYYYSGRGYHIYMPDYFKFEESFVAPVEVKNTLNEYFPEADLSIYQQAGLIRAPYSLNAKTNKFKIPLTYDEIRFMHAKDILKLAESNTLRQVPSPIPDKNKDWHKKIVVSHTDRDKIAHRDEPTTIVTCMQHLFNRGEIPGRRHDDLMRLISSWRRMGQTKEACVVLALKFAPSLGEYEIRKIVNNAFEKGYVYGCNDRFMTEFCDPKCKFYEFKNYKTNLHSGDDVRTILADSARLKRRNKYIDIGKILGLKIPYRIYLGQLAVFWGDVKLGKSTLIQNIVAQTPDINWLYLPLENGIGLDSRRLIQIKTGVSKEKIEEIFDEGTYEEQMMWIDHIRDIKFSEDNVTVHSLRKMIAESEADAVVIDTIDQMKADSKEYNDGVRNLTVQLRDLTRMTKKAVLVVHHISKHAALDEDGNRRRLNIHSGLGTSALEQKADIVIGIEGDRNKDIRIVSSLGARDEDTFETQLYFDKTNFRLHTMNGRETKK